MPLHDHQCTVCAQVQERFVALADLDKVQGCEYCGNIMTRVFLTAPMGFVQRDICYDSPIDGRPITSHAARREDLRRNDCVEWDSGMKKDFERNRRNSEESLDRAVDATVDEFVATAPARKRELLEQELRAGASVEATRVSPATT